MACEGVSCDFQRVILDVYLRGGWCLRSRMERVGLDALPREVLLEILSWMDVGHIVVLTQVSRKLREDLIGDGAFWRSLIR